MTAISETRLTSRNNYPDCTKAAMTSIAMEERSVMYVHGAHHECHVQRYMPSLSVMGNLGP